MLDLHYILQGLLSFERLRMPFQLHLLSSLTCLTSEALHPTSYAEPPQKTMYTTTHPPHTPSRPPPPPPLTPSRLVI